MPKAKDLIGQRFGKLVCEKQAANSGLEKNWWCICDCGNKTVVQRSSLVSGNSISCNCERSKRAKEHSEKARASSIRRWNYSRIRYKKKI